MLSLVRLEELGWGAIFRLLAPGARNPSYATEFNIHYFLVIIPKELQYIRVNLY